MKYKAVLLDLDGTLVHTSPEYRYTIVGETLTGLGIKTTNDLIDKFWFETSRDKIIRQDFGLNPEIFWAKYRERDHTELRRKLTWPYNDIDFVKELKRIGCKTGIVTGAPPHIASLEISMIGEENFDCVVIASESRGIRPKPDAHGIEEALRFLNTQNNEAMYIGNAEEDILAARNANVLDILLIRGEYKLPEIKPSLKIHSLYDLREILQ